MEMGTDIEINLAIGEMVRSIDINLIEPNPQQFRKHFTGIEELAESIKSKGIRIPLKVARRGEKYRLVCGERRWRAGKQAGLKTLPCIIVSETEENTDETGLIENLHRKGLALIDEALAVKEFETRGYNGVGIIELTGFSQSRVSKLLKIAVFLREAIAGGFATYADFAGMEKVGLRAFYEASQMEDKEEAVEMLKQAAKEGYSSAFKGTNDAGNGITSSSIRPAEPLQGKTPEVPEVLEYQETDNMDHTDNEEQEEDIKSDRLRQPGADNSNNEEPEPEIETVGLSNIPKHKEPYKEKSSMSPARKLIKTLKDIGAGIKSAREIFADIAAADITEKDEQEMKECREAAKLEMEAFREMLMEIEEII